MEQGPESLFERLRRTGSRADWERFADLYGALLRHWANRLTHPGDAADLVQDVLVRVMEKLPSFAGRDDRSFIAWLRAVMVNRWRDVCRRSAARPPGVEPGVLEAVVGDAAGPGAADAADRDLLVRRALQVMRSDFEPTTWRACWETVVADRPAAEVAAELGVSVDVVYAAGYRVIRRLRAELAGAWD